MMRLTDITTRLLATAFGGGYSPLAPGTAGSAVGVLLFWPLSRLGWPWQLGACLAVFLLGVVVAGRLSRQLRKEDPGVVVIDEVVGQWITLAALPFTPAVALLGFVLFRVMDVVKPWPARDLEGLHGGWGIMADDVMAGIYAHLALRVALIVWPVAV